MKLIMVFAMKMKVTTAANDDGGRWWRGSDAKQRGRKKEQSHIAFCFFY
jgi:hypothetical protein